MSFDRKQRFSIRKYSVGVASVLIGTVLAGTTIAAADTEVKVDELLHLQHQLPQKA